MSHWLILIVAVGALLRFAPVWFGLPYMQSRPDEDVAIGGGTYVALDLSRAEFQHRDFDPATESFGDAAGRKPDWVVLYESPVAAYARSPVELRSLVSREYELAHTVRATGWRPRRAVYDLQDAFFMPVWGLWTVERPGPTIRIYRHRAG